MEHSDFITNNAEETKVFGRKIADRVKNGGIICLYGDLGSGKTTFTQGVASALGIERHVNSPTFLITRTYELAQSREPRAKRLYHLDLYRLESEREMEDIGLQEVLDNPENIVVIEWSEKLGALLPNKRIDIHFEYVDEKKRNIQVIYYE